MKQSKYYPLEKFLKTVSESITLSFDEIEKIIGFRLPQSAYMYAAWWANDEFHSHSRVWINSGMYVKNVKVGISVTFSKN